MNVKLGLAFLLLAAPALAMPTAADDPKAPPPNAAARTEADPFVGAYVEVPLLSGGGGRRFALTRQGDHYTLDDRSPGRPKNGYAAWPFVRKTDTQLQDEKGSLGTITLGRLTFEDGKGGRIPVLRVNFCYEHFLLLRAGSPGLTP